MSQPSLPSSLRLIIFTMQLPARVNAIIDAFQALGQQVLLVVTCPDPYRMYQGTVTYSNHGQDTLVTNHLDRLPAMLGELAPGLIYCAGFPFQLSPELLALPRLGCVNVHPSLLPKYRGPRPLFWQLMHGETQTGLTFQRMDTDIDTGPILLQRRLDMTPDDDARSVWGKLLRLEVSMLPELLTTVVTGASETSLPIEEASYAPLLSLAERQLDWTRPATYLHNQIRALALNGAQARVDGQDMLVHGARVVSWEASASTEPGRLLACSAEGILIQTGQDALLITEYVSEDQIRTLAFLEKKR